MNNKDIVQMGKVTRETLKMPLKKKAESKDCNRHKTNEKMISQEIF